MTAFAFNGTCTAYEFNSKLCSCLGGEKVIYVANSSISYAPPATVPFSTAPHINTTVENIELKQYQLVNFFTDVFSQLLYPYDVVISVHQYYYAFPREDGNYNALNSAYLDVASCVTDTPCGMPVLVNTTWPPYYILNECGKTIQLSFQKKGDTFSVYSHPGFGCKAFPDGPTNNCNVTFTTTGTMYLSYYGYFSGTDGSCDGYTLGVEPIRSGTSEKVDLCIYPWHVVQQERLIRVLSTLKAP
ncbi:uncharacterized protein LOC125178853 [Hyalella azteca]|uniref:Uncharacterized protein LOC125178853 n=1 Tax=Hyalella azteca TaxID=294128 RepID=A0A979FSD8_HYAAZ|nr:uncharacterized protein LOC125178853 [Hyalella azteca]